jgi:serine/threonine-protein phosphatase 2A regulatory subunit B
MMKFKKVRILKEIVEIELSFLVADLISTIEFNDNGELLAVGDKGGRIVVFQREQQVTYY